MTKKKEEEVEMDVVEEVTSETAPTPLAYDFGREDLNDLQKAVNYLLAKGE